MAKFIEKLKARSLRKQGKSMRTIARLLDVSKSSVSLWCRDIVLSDEQIAHLHQNKIRGGYVGRLKGALLQKNRKEEKIRNFRREGTEFASKINKDALMFIGLGLFLGEGSKGESRVRFSNSDPGIIRLAMHWFMQCLDVSFEDFEFRIYINESHRSREQDILKKWRVVTGARIEQFRKSVFIQSTHKKVYENPDSYIGTASLIISRSTDLQYRILGLCYGIVQQFDRLPM